jgi:hypothetical protein
VKRVSPRLQGRAPGDEESEGGGCGQPPEGGVKGGKGGRVGLVEVVFQDDDELGAAEGSADALEDVGRGSLDRAWLIGGRDPSSAVCAIGCR